MTVKKKKMTNRARANIPASYVRKEGDFVSRVTSPFFLCGLFYIVYTVDGDGITITRLKRRNERAIAATVFC